MALVWMRQEGEVRYEVRRAGQALRLYSNGVFHSQYNPREPVTGSVWDLLLLPAFALPSGRPARVLVLGVGGGAVIRQLNTFVRPDLVVGIELNPVHLEVAAAHFGAGASNVCLLEADARHWLEAYRGPAFDLVIDDLFGHVDGDAVRAIEVDDDWARQLTRVLSPGGVLVINFEGGRELRQSAVWRERQWRGRWAEGQRFTTPRYANAVGAFFRHRPDWAMFERRLAEWPALDRRRSQCRLRYQRKAL